MSYSSPCSWECLAQRSAQEVSFTWLLNEEMFLNEPGSYQLSSLFMWYFCQDIINVVRCNVLSFLEAEAEILPDLNAFSHFWKCFLGENPADTGSMFSKLAS